MSLEQQIGTATQPLRVAIIGAGPAGFYAAESLFKHTELNCQIDMFNRFPTPFGLVREGVAPDHQTIKSVTRIYDKIAENPKFRYFGNVTFGSDILLEDLQKYYDQIIFAFGAQSDRRMGIPGEDLLGSYPATIFVGWYNGHPDYWNLDFDLSCERVAVVGNGNVAMDVARILVTNPDELATTDICDYSLERLRQSKIKEVIMLGRRGPVQAAFTNPELKEFGELAGVDVIVHPADLELDETSQAALASDKNATRNVETLKKYLNREQTPEHRKIDMRFLVSPVEILGEDGKVKAVRLEKNRLVAQADGSVKAVGTGEYELIEVGMVFRSVGYKGVAVPGLPFDGKNSTIPNKAGRVYDPQTDQLVAGSYVVGWAKRGPSGIIGTNKPDSAATVASMVGDLLTLTPIPDENRDPELIVELLKVRKPDYITYAHWQLINRAEVERGVAQGRPRVKFTSVPEMLEALKQPDTV